MSIRVLFPGIPRIRWPYSRIVSWGYHAFAGFVYCFMWIPRIRCNIRVLFHGDTAHSLAIFVYCFMGKPRIRWQYSCIVSWGNRAFAGNTRVLFHGDTAHSLAVSRTLSRAGLIIFKNSTCHRWQSLITPRTREIKLFHSTLYTTCCARADTVSPKIKSAHSFFKKRVT